MTRRVRLMPLLVAVLMAGCQGPGAGGPTDTTGALTGSAPPAVGGGAGGGGRGVRGPAAPGELVVNPLDPCVTNLGALVENLILYYSLKNKLPESLGELRDTSVSGVKISLVCPETGKPYVYVPRGIHPPYDVMPTASVLILYDAAPAHPIVKHIAVGKDEYDLKQTVRYGIVYKPTKPGEPVSMHVAPIEESLLKMYLNAPQPQSGTVPAH